MTLVMIIPSRGRPEAALEAATVASARRGSLDTRIVVAVDGDPDSRYRHDGCPNDGITVRRQMAHCGMVGTLNDQAVQYAEMRHVTHLGFMGDDHRVRTPGWDTELMLSAGPCGVAYGDDLNMGDALPTSVVLSASIVDTLGYMAPPTLGHLYVDDFWRALGLRLGRLAYRSDIVIEHMHPSIGKGRWDDQYRSVNAERQYEVDEAAWKAYRDDGALTGAVAALQARYADLVTAR